MYVCARVSVTAAFLAVVPVSFRISGWRNTKCDDILSHRGSRLSASGMLDGGKIGFVPVVEDFELSAWKNERVGKMPSTKIVERNVEGRRVRRGKKHTHTLL